MLRHPEIGLFYAGHKHWVGSPSAALDLGTVEMATEMSRNESFEDMDVVVTYGDSCCDLVLPIRRKGTALPEPSRAAA